MTNGFNTDKFKNFIEYKSGYTWSKDQELNSPENSSIRVLTVTNVQKELDLSSELYLKNVSENDKQEKAVSKNWTIAVSSNGNRKRIGNAVFIDEDMEYLFASFLTGFKPKANSEILPEYFSYWMKSHPIQERITSISEGTTGLGNLDIRYLRNMDIEYPPLPEQRAIASVLSKVDDSIAAVKKTIAKAERLKKSLMQNLLTGRLKPDGTRRTDDEFYTDEKFGKVPVGWEVKKVKDCFVFFPTSSYSRSKLTEQGECMYVHYGDIHTKFYCFIDLKNSQLPFITSEMGKKYTKLEEGDMIMADASEDYDGVGKCVEIMNINNSDIIAGLHTLHFRDKADNFVNGYKGYMFNNDKVRNSILRTATGIKVYSVSKSSLANILIPVPAKDEQTIIANRLDTMDNCIKSKELKIQKLERMKRALMQNLLTGKKRLKADYIQGFV